MGIYQNANLSYVIVKVESVPGTYVAPTTTEYVMRVRNIAWSPTIEMDDESAKYANGNHAESISIPGVQTGKISFETRCNVGASDILLAPWQTFAYACGCMNTGAYASTKGNGLVRRLAKDDTTYSITKYDVEIGIGSGTAVTTETRFAGCIGNMKIGCSKTGAPWVAKFEFMGKLSDIVDGTAIAFSSPGSVVPQVFNNHTVTIGGNARAIDSWEFDLGNEISPVKLQSDPTGISHYVITGSKPRFNCNPLSLKQAATGADMLGNILSKPASNTIQIGTPATGKLSLKIIDAQYLSMAQETRDGLLGWALNFKALENGVPGTLIDGAGSPALTYEDTFELLQGTRT
jgi:hypothetical protein